MPDYGQRPAAPEPQPARRRDGWAGWAASFCQGLVVVCLALLTWGSPDEHWRWVAAVGAVAIGGHLVFGLITRRPARSPGHQHAP